MPPSSFWCCCFLSNLFGGVAAVLPSRRSFWVVLFFPSHSRQLNGANEWNQVAVKQSEANESEVVHCWGGGVFLPPSFWVAVFSPYFPCRMEVFSLLFRLGGSVFRPSPPLRWWFFPSSSVWVARFSPLSHVGRWCFPAPSVWVCGAFLVVWPLTFVC